MDILPSYPYVIASPPVFWGPGCSHLGGSASGASEYCCVQRGNSLPKTCATKLEAMSKLSCHVIKL